MNTAWATVEAIVSERTGCARVACRMPDGSEAPAVCYPDLVGPVAPGDRVLLNTTAMDLHLGTGGTHFVIANASAPGTRSDRPGHIIKLRYTPLQAPVLAVEEPDSPWHAALQEADGLDGMPVVCCELLSQVPAVLAGLAFGDPAPRVAAVVTGEAALPFAFSDLLARLRDEGRLAAVVTAGQAFGGDLEAVNLHSALLAARIAAGAEVAIVTPGPGTVGTRTRWGFGGVAQGEALNAAHSLGGRAVAVVRASAADPRPRHRGISHHTRTVFTRVALGGFFAAWPAGSGDPYLPEWEALVRETNGRAGVFGMEAHRMERSAAALDAFAADGPPWMTMGRDRKDDPLFFETAAAAGLLARRLWREGTNIP